VRLQRLTIAGEIISPENSPPLVGGDDGEGGAKFFHPQPYPLPSRERESLIGSGDK